MTARVLWVLVAGTTLAPPLWAEVPIPHLYVAPTAGILRWDEEAIRVVTVDETTSEALGIRAGYSPIAAFSGEIVVLTGSTEATYHGVDQLDPVSLRATQLELSLLVNFQTLVGFPVYPFLDLGIGAVSRTSDLTVSGSKVLDDTNAAFHLGGGLRWDPGERFGLRANFRDTFFNDTVDSDGREEQVTVDSIEISLSLEYRVPLGSGGDQGKDRLR